jgi:hypothetical protein
MNQRLKLGAGLTGAIVLSLVGTGLLVALPAQAAINNVVSSQTSTPDAGDGDGETADDATGVEDGTADGETADDATEVEDGTADGENADDDATEVEDGTADGETADDASEGN